MKFMITYTLINKKNINNNYKVCYNTIKWENQEKCTNAPVTDMEHFS